MNPLLEQTVPLSVMCLLYQTLFIQGNVSPSPPLFCVRRMSWNAQKLMWREVKENWKKYFRQCTVKEGNICMSEDEEELLRRQAARKDLDEKNFWVIVRQLNDNNSTFRWKAAESLGRICDPRAVVPLIELMKDPVPEVQWVAAQSLGKCHDSRSVEPLIGYLRDSDRWVRQGAAWALGEIGDRSAVTPLYPLLKDRKKSIRETAAEALGKLGDTRAIDALKGALDDEEYEVRQAAREALKKISP
jgi:HEAT repeat protein